MTTRPILRWAGSKRQLLPELRQYWPRDARRYIEPFCGSACLFFDLQPPEAILGDLNSELIVTYRALQRDPALVAQCLRRLRKGRISYYAVRAVDPDSLSDTQQAARFLYLNRYCFNGIYRTNLKGRFNVPYGPQKRVTGHDMDSVVSAARLLQNVTFLNADFEETLKRAERGDFVYLDPPFAVRQRRIFSEYHPSTFTVSDLERLGACLTRLDKLGVRFVVSYADSQEARSLFSPWWRRRVWTRRNVAGFATHRRGAYELMATNLESEYAH
jgi:DNA adenine methylase